MATTDKKRAAAAGPPANQAPPQPPLDSEFATRRLDPFEVQYLGLIRTNDPLLLERGGYGQAYEIYRDLKRDGKVFSGLQKRKHSLVSKPYQVEPLSDGDKGTQDAATVAEMLKRCNFDQVCKDLMEALIAGFTVMEVVWTVRDGLIVPQRLVKRANRRFVYKDVDDNQPPQLRLLTREHMLDGEEVPANKFVVHRVNPEDDNPYGTGLGLQLYWPVFFKRKGVIAWNKLCDRFGSPTPHGKYPPNAGPKEKSTLRDALRGMSNDGYLMTPDGMAIELLESKLTGSVTTQQELCTYMDDWIDSVLLGTEPRAKGGGAMAAASQERMSVRMDLVQADSDLLSDTLNETLLKWICQYNGLEPCGVTRVIKEEIDLQKSAETDVKVYSMGFRPTLDSVRAKYGDGWEPDPNRPLQQPPPQQQTPGDPTANAPAPPGPGGDNTAQFAEHDPTAGQLAIDKAIASVDDAELQDAMGALFEPLLKAIDQAKTFEDALAAAEAAYPEMDGTKLQALLAKAMFGADVFAQQVEKV